MDDLLFITGVTTEGIQFINKHIDIHKDQTLLYFNHYCTEELMFERNWDEVFDDLNKNIDIFWKLYGYNKNENIWNDLIIPRMNDKILESIFERKQIGVLKLIVNHEHWMDENPLKCFISNRLNFLEKFLKQKETRKKTFEWINFIRIGVNDLIKKEINPENIDFVSKLSEFYVNIMILFFDLLKGGLKVENDICKIKDDSTFEDTNFMTLIFSTIIQLVDKKYLSIDEELYVRKNFVNILENKKDELLDIISSLPTSIHLFGQLDLLLVEKQKIIVQIEIEEKRIDILKKERVQLQPLVINFSKILFEWISNVIVKKIKLSSIDDALYCFSSTFDVKSFEFFGDKFTRYIETIISGTLTKNIDVKINVIYTLYYLIAESYDVSKFSITFLSKLAECFNTITTQLDNVSIFTEMLVKNKLIYIFS